MKSNGRLPWCNTLNVRKFYDKHWHFRKMKNPYFLHVFQKVYFAKITFDLWRISRIFSRNRKAWVIFSNSMLSFQAWNQGWIANHTSATQVQNTFKIFKFQQFSANQTAYTSQRTDSEYIFISKILVGYHFEWNSRPCI